MTTTKEKKKKFTVGLWMDLETPAQKSYGMQIWHIESGNKGGEGLKWFTVVLATNEKEALKLGQDVYSGKVPKSDTAAAA